MLLLPQEQIPDFLSDHELPLASEDVFGLFLNIQYRGNVLTVTTGSSLRVFSGNRELDRAWDQAVRDFLGVA